MRDLSFLGDVFCLMCSARVGNGEAVERHFAPSRRHAVGNCAACCSRRMEAVQIWERYELRTCAQLLREHLVGSQSPDVIRRCVLWWLAERRSPTEAVETTSSHLRRCQDSGQPIATSARRPQSSAGHPVAAAPPR